MSIHPDPIPLSAAILCTSFLYFNMRLSQHFLPEYSLIAASYLTVNLASQIKNTPF
jgi:hypothetical protein